MSQSKGHQGGWGLKHVIHEERLSTGFIQPGDEKVLGDLNGICNCLTWECVEKMDPDCSHRCAGIGHDAMDASWNTGNCN